MNQNRQPEGIPTGGQFAATDRAESAADLAPHPDQARHDLGDILDGLDELNSDPENVTDDHFDQAGAGETILANAPAFHPRAQRLLTNLGEHLATTEEEADPNLVADDLRHALLVDALGDGDDLTAEEQQALDILTDRANDDFCSGEGSFGVMLEELESYGNDPTFYGPEKIADRLYAHHEKGRVLGDGNAGGFSFGLESTAEGETVGYTVSAYLGVEHGVYLSSAHDAKYLDPDRYCEPGATGLRKAVALAASLEGDYQQVRAKAQKLDLLEG